MMIVFGYNFHHQKTQDFLFYCRHYGYTVEAVLAADWRDLGLPKKRFRTNIRTCGTIHPAEICESQNIPFHIVDHNSAESLEILDRLKPAIGLIAGSRILSPMVVDSFSKGIINFHPGLIPEIRGLDCVQWALHKELPLGMTAHLIDSRIDAGRMIERNILQEFENDTLIDLEQRIYQLQLKQFSKVIDLVCNHPIETFPEVASELGPACGSFPQELELEMMEKFTKRFPLSGLVEL